MDCATMLDFSLGVIKTTRITPYQTGRGGRVVLGAISNLSRENALGPRF